MAEKRPMRMCDSCGGVDSDPRHVFAYAEGDGETEAVVASEAIGNASREDLPLIMAQIADRSTTMKHMDCCRADGCPDGTCNVVTAGAEDKRGAALVRHLTKGK